MVQYERPHANTRDPRNGILVSFQLFVVACALLGRSQHSYSALCLLRTETRVQVQPCSLVILAISLRRDDCPVAHEDVTVSNIVRKDCKEKGARGPVGDFMRAGRTKMLNRDI
jgi:hypothetical protein